MPYCPSYVRRHGVQCRGVYGRHGESRFWRGVVACPVRVQEWPRGGVVSYGPPWAHYLGGCQDRLLGGPLGLPGLRYTAPEGVEHKDYTGVVLG
jgi:hypothetical protein